jgi:amidase
MASIHGFASAQEMLEALHRREISALELLDLHIRRIERYDHQLNAIVIRCFEDARRAAQSADAARARGDGAPLLGLPMTLKESINVRGLQTTGGMPMWAEYRAEHDAAVTQRIQAAGAVLMGKTNVPPMLADWQSDNAVFGRTNNPWDLTRTPGGSTGGGAAALAAGLTPLEVGSDIGGSIRVPAAFCGVYGHRPSETALPRSGQMPFPPIPNPLTLMGVQGPLARSADDLELALDVLAGPEGGEEVAWRLDIPPARHARLAEYRVAVLPPVDWVAVDADILAAQDVLVRGLERAGVRVQMTQPEAFGDLRAHHVLYRSLLAAITGARTPEPERRRLVDLHAAHSDEFSAAHCRGLLATVSDYLAWYAQRDRYRTAYRAFFKDWDILLAPITLVPAFPHLEMPWPRDAQSLAQTVEVNGRPVPYGLQLVYPALATLSGQPATAFPVGLTRSGLPIGLQAIGPYLEDRTPIRFAALVSQEFGGFRSPPGYDAADLRHLQAVEQARRA